MPTSDRRRTRRFSLGLNCRIFSPFHTFGDFTGVTENVSRTGILIRVTDATPDKQLPVVGNSARIVVSLPVSKSFSQKYLDCEVTVVRVGSPQEEFLELGFRVRRMQFRDQDSMSRVLSIAGRDSAALRLVP